MDCSKVGALLYRLRSEKGMTQRQVAQRLRVSDQAISKWERGLGCPDVSLLSELSELFEVSVEKILEGTVAPNAAEPGNLARMKFYGCPYCGNVISNTGQAEISCCGRKLSPLAVQPADGAHRATVEDTDDSYYITFDHEMRKEHYLSFVAYVANDRLVFIKLYPEQEASVILPKAVAGWPLRRYGRKFYFYCSVHGLFAL